MLLQIVATKQPRHRKEKTMANRKHIDIRRTLSSIASRRTLEQTAREEGFFCEAEQKDRPRGVLLDAGTGFWRGFEQELCLSAPLLSDGDGHHARAFGFLRPVQRSGGEMAAPDIA